MGDLEHGLHKLQPHLDYASVLEQIWAAPSCGGPIDDPFHSNGFHHPLMMDTMDENLLKRIKDLLDQSFAKQSKDLALILQDHLKRTTILDWAPPQFATLQSVGDQGHSEAFAWTFKTEDAFKGDTNSSNQKSSPDKEDGRIMSTQRSRDTEDKHAISKEASADSEDRRASWTFKTEDTSKRYSNCSHTNRSSDKEDERVMSTQRSRSTKDKHVMSKQESPDLEDRRATPDILETHIIMNTLHEGKVGTAEKNAGFDEKLVGWINTCWSWWSGIQEPPRKGWVFRIVSSHSFEITCMAAIMINSGLAVVIADWQIQNIGASEPDILNILVSSLDIFFMSELFLRLLAHRFYYFLNNDMAWNIFDAVLVSFSFVDFLYDKLADDQAGGNVNFMRLMRFLKLTRVLRSLRSFKFFKSLTVLLESMYTSFMSLFWGLFLMAFVLYLFALLFMQALTDYLTHNMDDNSDLESEIESSFGSFSTTMLSMYMSVTGGDDWSKFYNILSLAGWAYGVFFIFFTFLWLFALYNILTGALVEKAMAAAKPDRTDRILRERKKLRENKHEFAEICKTMDKDHDGMISYVEFKEAMHNPIMAAYVASVGIEIHDIEFFFHSVVGAHCQRSGGSVLQGKVSIDQFVEGCLRMKGSATAIDMQRQLFEIEVIHEELKKLKLLCREVCNERKHHSD